MKQANGTVFIKKNLVGSAQSALRSSLFDEKKPIRPRGAQINRNLSPTRKEQLAGPEGCLGRSGPSKSSARRSPSPSPSPGPWRATTYGTHLFYNILLKKIYFITFAYNTCSKNIL
jgi:hypothetical protein